VNLRGRIHRWLLRAGGFTLALELPAVRFAWIGPRVDPLTGLPDRTVLRAALEIALSKGPAALLFVDLDGFKAINDRHGHAGGDRVLVELAARMRAWRRRGEFIGRWGGDEWLAVLPDATLDDAIVRADDLLVRLRGAVPFPEQVAVACTASIGIAAAPRHTEADEILAEADRALYAAKTAGRDRHALPPLRLLQTRD
jgi:diguanylate cyclase (GGDEF)-like protein